MGLEREYHKIISNQDGLELSLLLIFPKDNIRGIVQIHHGMVEFKERYIPFMEYLAGEGFVTAIHDCRGHGMSVKCDEDLGYTYGIRADGLVEDTYQVTALLKERWPALPIILLGHSMGSLVVRTYAKKYDQDIDMLIVCGSPSKNSSVGFGKMVATCQMKMFGEHYRSKFIKKASFGPYERQFPDETSSFCWGCSDPEVVAQYEASPLCDFVFTVDGYLTLFDLMEETYSKKGWAMGNPELPILFLGGAQDPCIGGARKYAQSIQFLRLLGYKKVKGRLYPGMRHEILNEINRHIVYQEIKKYIEKYVKLAE